MGSYFEDDFELVRELSPDDANAIGSWKPAATVRQILFDRVGAPIFGEEMDVNLELAERKWEYRLEGRRDVQQTTCWRLEVSIPASDVIAEGQKCEADKLPWLIVTRHPYGSEWVQRVQFKRYSKKQREFQVIPKMITEDKMLNYLEEAIRFDPWEYRQNYVAGISRPSGYGFRTSEPRNTRAEYVFGFCGEPEKAEENLFRSQVVTDLLHQTEINKIGFTFSPMVGGTQLYPEVIDDAKVLMLLSIRQALAGPDSAEDPNTWTGRPVTDLVNRIYRDHLNQHNRREHRLQSSRDRLGHDIEEFA